MTVRTRIDPVLDARSRRVGIGAFNVVLLEHAEAIAQGAERAGLPVVFQISQNCVEYHGGLEPVAAATLSIVRAMSVPALVHLDHADDVDLVTEAVELGMDSVMFDGSKLPYDDNVALTRRMVELCHARGVRVEAELGEIGGKDGVHAPGVRTDPDDARRFVEHTGVDWLAVAVGTSHAMTAREAAVDTDLITRIAGAAAVPLVLHGSSGLDDEMLRAAVAAGMTKINISTHLNALFTDGVRAALDAEPERVDPRRWIGSARDSVAAEVERLLRLLTLRG
ncbi:class II fructose-bisphosphate aldolase [uncultured Microbacterium sp.]|uniref:class II fructose-bisphosphate aldolase n=1 Tax=uncultured Microbacterium sp. TaxID=191216 RepID=UPI0025DBC58F|nr:class II fructose-bisphosphate aldolase [uncultured Microbacterium sp.]